MNNPEPQQHSEPALAPALEKKKTNVVWWWLLGATGSIIIIALIILSVFLYRQGADGTPLSQHQGVANDGNKNVTAVEGTIASAAERVAPSVVSVVTKVQAPSFYGTTLQQGAGTGIIVSKDGVVMTNKHVVQGADTVGVILSDGTRHDNVKVLGVDPLNDVAFLKVSNVSNLSAAELGDSSSVRVGQQVVAIGNSLGQYANTVTSGIISGLGRPVSARDGELIENLSDLLQTDAAINPGNSGGPLLNLEGQVVGINTAIAEDAQSIGFAIPINATKGILKGVLADGTVARSYLGVSFIPVTADVAEYYKLPVKKGAYVIGQNGSSALAQGGPADKAGVKERDIIVKVGGSEVGPAGGVSSLVGEYAPGERVQLEILRDGRVLRLEVALGTYKAS